MNLDAVLASIRRMNFDADYSRARTKGLAMSVYAGLQRGRGLEALNGPMRGRSATGLTVSGRFESNPD